MSTNDSVLTLQTIGLQELRKRWGWFVGLGAILVMLGTLSLGYSVLTTLFATVFIGWLMIVGGVLQAIHAFSCKAWGGFFLDLLFGILYAVAGVIIIRHPAEAAMELTLLIALLLIFSGIFRIVSALAVRFPNWIWLLLNGVVNLLLGLSVWHQWPISGLWVIGLFVGIDMLFNGWTLIMMGLAARSLPGEAGSANS
jgi:uncharacterized membrane protein HdeD (DUF308 family)